MKEAITPEKMTAPVALTGKGKSISYEAQQRRVIRYLETNSNGLNYIEAEPLGIARLGARIFELKARGYTFLTIYEDAIDQYGNLHKGVARYFLTGYPAKEAA